jgi:hypothetical protein
MSGKAQGQVSLRRRAGETRSALRFTAAGKHRHLAVGADREGSSAAGAKRAPVSSGAGGDSLGSCNSWNPGALERALLALGAGFVAGDARPRSRKAGR